MRVGDTVKLAARPSTLENLQDFLVGRTRGRRVLNIGAAGGVENYLPDAVDLWFHAKLVEVAQEAIALDIDAAGIAHAARHGWTINTENCETMDLGRRFDVALMIDVIEHVEAPSKAIGNVLAHLEPAGELIITTPNPGYIGDVVRTLRGRDPSIYWDHQALFGPEHLQAICDRHGWDLAEVAFFSHRDQRNSRNRRMSDLVNLIGRWNPRLSGSWLGVVRRRP